MGGVYTPIVINTKDGVGDLSRDFDELYRSVQKLKDLGEKKIKEQTSKLKEQREKLVDQQRALLNVLEDVQLEKKVSQQRANDLKKFMMAVDGASDHIVITDADGIVVYANKSVERITGFTTEEIVGKKAGSKDLWGGLMPLDFYQELWKTIKIDKKPFGGEINNKRKSGDKYVAMAQISPILDESGNVVFFVGIERDITRMKEIDRMKTEFISLASHQLNTPLSAMKWFLEMLLSGDAGELTDEQKRFIGNINQSNERMISLVNSLLNVSRIESGRIIIDPKPTDLGEILRDLQKELDQKIKSRKVNFVLDIDPTLQKVNVDPKLIRHVYMNLLTNAIKYTQEGGNVWVSLTKDDKNAITRVSDNGMGIPKEEQSKIFDKFFRASNAVEFEADGSGLGLYLVKAIVESSGGNVWLESEVKKGSTFWVTLPLSGSIKKEGQVSISSLA